MGLAAVVSALAVTVVPSGAFGTVLIDPARPVCIAGQPCTAPDAHEVLAFWRRTKRIATATTGVDGRFRVTLVPGVYRITAPHRAGARVTVSPAQIRVLRGRFARVTIHVDVGIR
jgi:hypothetical protein